MPIGIARPKKPLYWFLTVMVAALSVLAVDVLIGSFDDLAIIREHSLKFRSEAADLSVRTKNLVPNLIHRYDDIIRPEVDDHLATDTPRFFRTDEYGIIRGPERKPAGYRSTILFLGGSTTETNEVDEQFRFPALVEALLAARYHLNVRTWNSGIRGHTTIDSINLLLNHPTYKNADVVVLMHNINDRLRLAIQGGYGASLYSPPPLSFAKVTASAAEFASDIWDFLSYRSNLLFVLRTRLNNVNPFIGEPTNPAINEKVIEFDDRHFASSLKTFRLNIETFVALARTQKQTPVLMTQPLGQSSKSQDTFNEEIRQVASEKNVLLIDLDKALSSERQALFLSDNIHLNNQGSIAAAKVIARELAKPLGSNVTAEDYTVSNTAKPETLIKQCLPAPDSGRTFVPGPRHVLLNRSGRYPTFSPDGEKLLFQTYQGGHERIQFYDIKTQDYQNLSDPSAQYMDRHPVVISQTINGSFTIAYGSDRSGSERIYLMDWPSKKVQPLLSSSDLNGAIPTRGPGQTVLFAGFRQNALSAAQGTPDLFMYDLASKQLNRLTKTEEEEWRPVTSHDGTLVYYISNHHGDFDIFRKLLTGSKAELIYRSKADEWDPSISTNDRWLAFASKQKGNWDLFVMDLSHPATVIQITDGLEDDWDPAFYIDERMIAFASSNGDQPRIFALCTFGELKD